MAGYMKLYVQRNLLWQLATPAYLYNTQSHAHTFKTHAHMHTLPLLSLAAKNLLWLQKADKASTWHKLPLPSPQIIQNGKHTYEWGEAKYVPPLCFPILCSTMCIWAHMLLSLVATMSVYVWAHLSVFRFVCVCVFCDMPRDSYLEAVCYYQ